MESNGVAMLGLPRLIELTTHLHSVLESHAADGVDLSTPKEMHDEIARWLRLLGSIERMQLLDEDVETKFAQGRRQLSKYDETLCGITRHLEHPQTSVDPWTSYFATQELQKLKKLRGRVVRWVLGRSLNSTSAPDPSTLDDYEVVDGQHNEDLAKDIANHLPPDTRGPGEMAEEVFHNVLDQLKGTVPVQHLSKSELGSHHPHEAFGDVPDLVQDVTEDDIHDTSEVIDDQSLHANMMEKLKVIGAAMEAMGIHLDVVNDSEASYQEAKQSRELLTSLFGQTKEDFWAFFKDIYGLESRLAGSNNSAIDDPDMVMVNGSRYGYGTSVLSVCGGKRRAPDSAQSAKIVDNSTQTEDETSRETEPGTSDSTANSRRLGKTEPEVNGTGLSLSPIEMIEVTPIPSTNDQESPSPSEGRSRSGNQTLVEASTTFESFYTADPQSKSLSTIIEKETESCAPRRASYIGSDINSKLIIDMDTRQITKHLPQIVSGGFDKTGLELGVLEVKGEDWIPRFCDEHRYLNGVLMAVTVPKRLFLWHVQNFPVDTNTWTKGSLVRTMAIVTEPARQLHSFPLRLGRSLPAELPKLMLHWNLDNCTEPYVSSQFKDIVRAGGALQKKIGKFSYRQLIVCVTIPWSVCDWESSEGQIQALNFLDRMGIMGAIPVNEEIDGRVRETRWCPSRLRVGGTDKGVHAFIQEAIYTGSPDIKPSIAATPTRFVICTVRKGHVNDWVDAMQFSLGMSSKDMRYTVYPEAPLDLNDVEKFYRSGGKSVGA